MGLVVLGYLILVIVLGIASLYFLFRIIGRFRQKKEWFDYALLLPLTVVPFIYLTWPFLFGRLVYEVQCSIASGLSFKRSVDASATGYFLHDETHHRIQGVHFTEHAYAHQAARDLIAGKISFFEGSASFSGGQVKFPYIRIFLADKHSRLCKNYDKILQGIYLPPGKCLASVDIKNIESKYEVRGYGSHSTEWPSSVQFVERATGEKLAAFAWFNLNVPFFRSHSCPRGSPTSMSPLGFISTVVLRDSNGKALVQGDFDDLNVQAAKLKLHRFKEIPPRELDAAQNGTGVEKCDARALGTAFETHKISIYRGDGNVVNATLDGSDNEVHEVNLIVNNPTRRTVLSLNSYDPVVWNISRTPDSEVAGVVVTGHHGQAVLGVDRKTPVMISTQEYSPGNNCSQSEMGAIRNATSTAANGISTHKQAIAVIGHPDYQKSPLIFSNERALGDYATH